MFSVCWQLSSPQDQTYIVKVFFSQATWICSFFSPFGVLYYSLEVQIDSLSFLLLFRLSSVSFSCVDFISFWCVCVSNVGIVPKVQTVHRWPSRKGHTPIPRVSTLFPHRSAFSVLSDLFFMCFLPLKLINVHDFIFPPLSYTEGGTMHMPLITSSFLFLLPGACISKQAQTSHTACPFSAL